MIPTPGQLTFAVAIDWLTEFVEYHEANSALTRPIDRIMLRKIALLLQADPCLAKLEQGEPWFTLRAHDPLASLTVAYWAQLASGGLHEPEKIANATECAAAMAHWQQIRVIA